MALNEDNTMQEKWSRWEPIAGLSTNYYSESILDTAEDGFKIHIFDHTGKKVLISFSNSVEAYRSTDDSFTYETLDFLNNNYGPEFYNNWTFFKIENSEYLEWLKKQSGGTFEMYSLKHFCIFTINAMIDIAVSYEPDVSHIDLPIVTCAKSKT